MSEEACEFVYKWQTVLSPSNIAELQDTSTVQRVVQCELDGSSIIMDNLKSAKFVIVKNLK